MINLSIPLIPQRIKETREEIFRLAKLSPSLEIMHWYMSLDQCFENDEFSANEFGNVQWRCFVLQSKKEPIDYLLRLISSILRMTGCIDVGGRPIKKLKQGLLERTEGP
jgi:hypothetical protein